MKVKLIVGSLVVAAGLGLGWAWAKLLHTPGLLIWAPALAVGAFLLLCCVKVCRTLFR